MELQGLRVLMVEDVGADADLAIHYLERAGIQCTHRRVDSEQTFRSALAEFRPHLILSDFTLPGFDGMTALEIIVKEAPDIPFIFLSGTLGEEQAIEALRSGALDYVLKANPGRLASAVRRALREVTERTRRLIAERQIRKSEQRLRDIVDTSQDWIWELDGRGRIVFCSESVQSMLGLKVQQVVGSPLEALMHEADRETFRARLHELTAGNRSTTGILTRLRHASGDFRWLECNVLALVGRQQRITGFRGTYRDITERKQQQEHILRLTRMLQMQSGINSAVVRIRERDALLRETCRLAWQVGGYERVMVSLVEPGGMRAIPWYRLGMEAEPEDWDAFPISDGTEPDTSLVGRALRTGEITMCTDLSKADPPVARREHFLADGFKSVVALPFSVNGARVGVLSLASRESDLLGDEELRLLQDITANLSFALHHRHSETTAQYLAYFDVLTGLAKRSLFCERLNDNLRNRLAVEISPSVVAFDVMHLSNLNDTFGRHVGDLLLQRVGERIKHHIEDDARVGYLGGGTFVLVLPELETSAENVTSFLESTVFKDDFKIEGRSIRVSFKSGIARYPADGEDANTLVQRAEAALKRAKESGEPYLHYQIDVHSELAERLALENSLRGALEERQFELYYQPQIHIESGRIEGVEALLRWNDPHSGLVLPGRFLPVLESSGMIVAVGDWVMRQAAADCQRWNGGGLGPIRVAVNVSAQQVRRRTFVEHCLAAYAQCPEGGLDIEITETGLLHDVEGASRKLRELRAAGMRVAIDDFGTGYSSLGLLSQLPVDLLKIDRSFISGLPNDSASVTLVSSIIGLASAFNLIAVAEGVETQEQLELLGILKCDQSQGFLHSKPVPAAQLEELLSRQARRLRSKRAAVAERFDSRKSSP